MRTMVLAGMLFLVPFSAISMQEEADSEAPYCPVCEKFCPDFDDLDLLEHLQEKHCLCTLCDSRFSSPKLLHSHLWEEHLKDRAETN